ncbi:YihY/virulence factor BrkB family protein [Brumimicrobium aurantiacum]|uniref:YihY/virulence factor BrkB family protein n=1 Tax=Brumimicrobium aurantiacum TaxID=1737063 RepID=A0A3E1EZQ3_9FLAO|nr:YihY/virulence factor BrkB family protein [Brumimicrobium aurantiacum]RFC54937.1 YihY/virulence factor BrkB family protein [Brumimicrobium aurantiacum]
MSRSKRYHESEHKDIQVVKDKNRGRRLTWPEIWELTKISFKEFFNGDSFMHGAALAYYTIFALVPILYLGITSFGLIMGQDAVIAIVGDLLETNMGISDVSFFTDLMYQWEIGKGGTPFLQIVGIIFLIFISTAMFNSLSKSLNTFFGIVPIQRYNVVLEELVKRLLSFGLMAVFGAIIIIIYFAQSILIGVGTRILSDGSVFQEVVFSIFEHVSILSINFLVFTFMFKYLHDGKVSWKLAMAGSLFTSILLYLGQLGVNYYLANYFFAANSGVAGTLLAVLTWIFYISQIIFLGAKFTSVYARMIGMPIKAK